MFIKCLVKGENMWQEGESWCFHNLFQPKHELTDVCLVIGLGDRSQIQDLIALAQVCWQRFLGALVAVGWGTAHW